MNLDRTRQSAERDIGAKHEGGEAADPRVQLRDYEALKFELASLVREASAEAWKQKNENLQRDFRLVLRRLAEDRFYLALAGQFNRGKTTLLNAMLGMDRLPTGIVPVTSVITAVSYNTRERAVMHFADSHLSHEVSLAELPAWITEKGNPGNQKKIEMAEVQLPAEMLRRGAFFVDTPGLGSRIEENSRTTERFLPQADAIIFVTSFEPPFSSQELRSFRRARSLVRSLFLVLNKPDIVTDPQRDQVLANIREQMSAEDLTRDLNIFAVSAKDALRAKLEGDAERLARSGLPHLESALAHFLMEKKSRDFMAAMCDRVCDLLARHRTSQSEDLRTRLVSLRDRALGVSTTGPRAMLQDQRPQEGFSDSLRMVEPCFVCDRTVEAVFGFLTRIQYDLSVSEQEQCAHAERRGFCAMHSWQYEKLASPRGVSTAYPRVLERFKSDLEDLSAQAVDAEELPKRLKAVLPSRDRCFACSVGSQEESQAIAEIAQEMQANPSSEPPSLCLPHLGLLLEHVSDFEAAHRLLAHASNMLDRLAENLRRFALKHDGLRRDRLSEEELRSPAQALAILTGHRNLQPEGSRKKS